MPFIIDGYNLLWSIKKTSEDLKNLSDFQLCQILSRFFKIIKDTGEVIFDGTGPPEKDLFENMTNPEVFYVGSRTDADSIIEKKIELNTAPRSLIVVSSDRRLRIAAKTRKAIPVKSEDFWPTVQHTLARPKRVSNEPREKQTGITESETDLWMKLFKLDK